MTEQNVVYGKTLVSLEIQTGEKIWNRSYLASYVPTDEQYECYYRIFCGFPDAKVHVDRIEVPNGFNANLLKPLDTAPTVFPVSDIETESEQEEKREAYKKFIKNIVEMEQNRINLNFFIEKPKESLLSSSSLEKLEGFRSWVSEVLDLLSTEMAVEIPQAENTETVGWILCPSAAVARRDNGYKLITDPVIGLTWEKLMGTDHFPDFVVARKLHTSGWTSPGEESSSLLRQLLVWYVKAKNAEYAKGVTDWIPGLDAELSSLTAAFHTVVPFSKTPTRLPPKQLMAPMYFPPLAPSAPGIDPEFDTLPSAAFPNQVKTTKNRRATVAATLEAGKKGDLRDEFRITEIPAIPTPTLKTVLELLAQLEKILAPASQWAANIEPATEAVFYKFLEALCDHLHIDQSELDTDLVSERIDRWLQQGLGFRPDLWPIVHEWFPVWRAVVRNRSTAARILFFLKTVQLKSIVDHTKMDSDTKETIVDGWLTIFMESFLVVESTSYIHAIDLQEQTRLFCLQFMPDDAWKRFFTPMSIGPFFTKRGFVTKKDGKIGRRTCGLRYRRPNETLCEMPKFTLTAMVFQSTIQTTTEANGTIRTTQSENALEINLGAI